MLEDEVYIAADRFQLGLGQGHWANHFANELPTSEEYVTTKLQHLIAGAKVYIAQNLDKDLSLESIARSASLSPYYFSRAFTRVVGMPPYRYLIHKRLQRSMELLRESEITVAEIAHKVGFGSHKHFSTTFRRSTGMSPSQYRRLCGTGAVRTDHHDQRAGNSEKRRTVTKHESACGLESSQRPN